MDGVAEESVDEGKLTDGCGRISDGKEGVSALRTENGSIVISAV